ncbi:MAG TPA: hypothetical protein VK850_13940, partial [Candidatus Binatia bacterium]|nr:hypothetical protein [Candidatus Binatia bacterium]
LPDGLTENWKKPGTYALLNHKSEPLPGPSNVKNADEAGIWAVDFWQTPAAREYNQRNRSFSLEIDTNGVFRAEGVSAGTYQLIVVAGAASLNKEINIPEAESPDQSVDLGKLLVTTQ